MNTHIITRDQLDSDNNYIGKTSLSNFDGHIEAEENLGYIKFANTISAKGYIYFKAGTGIEAGDGIKAGTLRFIHFLLACPRINLQS